ncbi:SRPBCC family protein [Paenibacillus thermotolerans]|uniref:SRPBCC family protein n=1 Tax=Paenibacillus thermotolerans TaxID=3027807 RepID=UPI002367ACF5|nr:MULTISPECIES: SRPBCC domain-containing protein [unclassified Paenibacillus]
MANAKPVGLTASAGYQIGVRRTLPITKEQAWDYLTSPEGLQSWLGDAPGISFAAGERYRTAEGTTGEMRVVKPYEQIRMKCRFAQWEKESTLQIRIIPAGERKTTVSFHQENLADGIVREEMKRRWELVLDRLADSFQ